jgi:hypothetical protein
VVATMISRTLCFQIGQSFRYAQPTLFTLQIQIPRRSSRISLHRLFATKPVS